MFQFRRFPTYAYLIQRRLTEYCSAGFPHSEIHGLTPMCGSPWLIAACHVLHRLLMPRHSPCALISLTSSERTSYPSLPCKHESSLTPSLLLFLANPLALGFARTDSGSQELCRLQIWFIVVCSYPFQNFHKFTLLPLCCLLAISCLHSLFSFQGAISSLCSRPDRNARTLAQTLQSVLVLVEVTGLEPVTPCLQSRCSTS